jgi:hypothetical protein
LRSGNNPGLTRSQNLVTMGLSNNFYNFSSAGLPVPVPAPTTPVLGVSPLNTRTDPLAGFDEKRVNPYIQNFNLEIQREIAKNLTFEARYIGSKGTKLYGGTSLNDVNIFAQGAGETLLQAFNETRAGQDAPLFDLLLRGLQLNPGQTVGQNGITGSAALRQSTLDTDLPGERPGRKLCQFPQHHDVCDDDGCRRNYQKRRPSRQLARRESAIRRRRDEHESRQLDLSLHEFAGDQAIVSRLRELIRIHMEPDAG